MASICSTSLLFSSSSSSSYSINAAIHVPQLPRLRNFRPVKKTPIRNLPEELISISDAFTSTVHPFQKNLPSTSMNNELYNSTNPTVMAQLHAILDVISDRIEMHKNIAEQRNNWNSLLLNSVNMITLTGATVAGLAATNVTGIPLLGLKLSSALLFSAATGMLMIMNKIQPSQLAEEQRNATRLFKQLETELRTMLITHKIPTEKDAKKLMEKVLAIDKAYPLPLLGKMLEKFPTTFEPASWWPNYSNDRQNASNESKQVQNSNGWSEGLEEEMKEIVQVIKKKDIEDYERLGNLVLKTNKILAISGPLLTGIAAVSSCFVGNGSWGSIVAVTSGALASAINSFEHGGQVGMVFEMYRNCAGDFRLMEDSIDAAIQEKDMEKRENGEVFEIKMALKLGRSLSQLRELAKKSASSHLDHGTPVDEFASKLF